MQVIRSLLMTHDRPVLKCMYDLSEEAPRGSSMLTSSSFGDKYSNIYTPYGRGVQSLSSKQ